MVGVDRRHRLDRRLRRLVGGAPIAGVDEVGRGCLAGPVVVAAVVLDDSADLPGVRDSKLMSKIARERAFDRIRACCHAWAALAVSPREVDARNVLHASEWGMARVVERLERRSGLAVDTVLVDGHRIPPDLDGRCLALVKGDDRSLSIAAASVVAKVARDRLMRSWGHHFPNYGFERHVGYPTREHLDALATHGPSPLHRFSFGPVAAAAQRRLDEGRTSA